MPDVKVTVDGEAVTLVQNGKSRNGTYNKYKEPEPYASAGPGEAEIIVTVYLKPGWKPPTEP